MKRRAYKGFGLLAGVLLLVAIVCGLSVRSEQKRYARNRNLIAALEAGRVEEAIALVQAGADPNTHVEPPYSPSFWEQVQFMVLRQPLPEISHYSTAFVLACCVAHSDVPDAHCIGRNERPEDVRLIEVMLAHGANANARVQVAGPVINIAVSLNHGRVAELLVRHGAKVNSYGGTAGTALLSAIENDNLYLVKLLLDHGALVNMKNGWGRSPLQRAIMVKGDKKIVEQLLAHGADSNLPEDHGRTPLQYAQEHHRPDIVTLLQRGK